MSESLSLRERELLSVVAALQVEENAAAARKASAIREFGLARALSQTSAGPVEPERVERDIVRHGAVACRVSPSEGRKRLHIARDLHLGLDHVESLFSAGELSEYKVQKIVSAAAHLDPVERAFLDARLASQAIERLGVRRIHDLARKIATEIAPDKALARARAARSGRRVTVRLALDGMADLILHLPAEQAAAAYAALCKAVTDVWVSPEPVTRSRGQVMADTAVERITGQATAGDVSVEVQVLLPLDALLDPASPLPAEVAGYGPIPAEIVREFLASTAGRKSLRRLVTSEGIVIGGESRRRCFDGFLETVIRARDGHRCSARYCDAPIRHIDHIVRWVDGGVTTFWNGRGLCAFHNHAREPVRAMRRAPRRARRHPASRAPHPALRSA